MARYQKVVDVWDPAVKLQSLQVGQWVEAGKGGDRGMWCGQRFAGKGSAVVMWLGNANNRPDRKAYKQILLQHGRES